MAKTGISAISIRPASAADAVLLAEVGAETFYDSFAADNTPENIAAYMTAAFSPDRQAQELADPASTFLIAEIAGTTVGYARIKYGKAPDAIPGQRPVEIVRFYARKPWIGKGVGAQLMQACLRVAEQSACDVIWLDVWEENPRAIAFYRRWGFEEVGTQIYMLGDDPQHDLLMARGLNPGKI